MPIRQHGRCGAHPVRDIRRIEDAIRETNSTVNGRVAALETRIAEIEKSSA